MLKQRLITAVLLIILVIAGLFLLPTIGFALISAILIGLAAWEWSRLMGLHYRSQRIFYLVIVLWIVLGAGVIPAMPTLFIGSCWWLLATYCVISYGKGWKYQAQSLVLKGIAGILVLVPCWIGLNALRAQPQGPMLVLFLLFLVWAADIGAYFAGKRFGKHLLLAKVSPGKTIEGVAGGVALALFVAVIEGLALSLHGMQWLSWLIVAGVTIVLSVVGDLFESVMKRQQGLKDSGNWLPGHGGILDRIDSLTAAAPVFALGILLMGLSG